MFCGRVCQYEKLEIRCESSGSGGAYNGSGNAVGIGHSSTVESHFDTAFGDTVGFVVYSGSSITDKWPHGTDVEKNWYGGADGPWGSISTGGEDWRDVTASVVFHNWRVYATSDGNWRVKYDSVDVVVNGGTIGSGGAFDKTSNTFMAPSTVPLFSGALYCEHTAGADWFGATGYIINQDAYVSAQGDGTFGVRWMIDGAWTTLPIAMPIHTQYAGGGDSYAFTLHANNRKEELRRYAGPSEDCTTGDGTPYDSYMLTYTSEIGGAISGWLFTNPPREAVRMNDEDYEAMVLRFGSLGWYDHYQTDPNPADGGRSYLTDIYTNVHPARSEYLARVTNAGHVFEDLLHEPAYCWLSESWNMSGPSGYLAIAPPGVNVLATDRALYPPCGNNEHDRRSFAGPYPSPSKRHVFPALEKIDGAPLAGNLGWEPQHTYMNTIASPHWSYFLFFPQDDAWKIDGVGVSNDELWYPARQQLIDHPALPGSDGTGHRSDILTECIDQNGITGLTQQVSGGMPCFWGIGGFFHAEKITMLDSVALDARAASRWKLDDGNAPIVDGSGITLPAGQTKVTFDLGSYFVWPFQTPHMAKEIVVAFDGTNVQTMDVYLIADDGSPASGGDAAVPPSRILIGSGAGTFAMPKGTSKKWITSSKYDGGADWGTDTYVGIAPAKDDGSLNTISDDEANVTLGNDLPTTTGAKIEFVVKVGDDTQTAKINHPTFHLHDEALERAMKECSRHTSILSKNGPVNRYGGGGYFDYGADTVTSYENPETAIVRQPMAGDWLTHKRPWFLGLDAHDGLDDEIATIYEQGVEYTMDKHLWRDPFEGALVTHSFITKNATHVPVACMVNSYSVVPPTGVMPSRRRSAGSDWQPTGTVGCYVYSLASSRKWVCAPVPVVVYDNTTGNTNNVLTSDPTRIPEGWNGGYFQPSQTTEHRYVIRTEGDKPTDWFKVRGWKGLITLIGIAKRTKGAQPFNLSDPQGRLHRVSIVDGKVHYCRSDSTVPIPGWAVDLDATPDLDDCASPRVSLGTFERTGVVFTRQPSDSEFDVYRIFSDDDGETWTEPDMLFPNCKYPTIATAPDGTTVVAAFEFLSGDSGPGRIKATIQRPGDTDQSTPFYFHDQDDTPLTVAEDTFHVSAAYDFQARWVLVVHMDGDDSVSDWWSTDDCDTFTRVNG